MVFASELIRPLGMCMLPVMLVTLVGMLEGARIMSALYVGFPAALAIAAIWTWVRVRDTIVEVHLGDGVMAIRSLIDAAAPARPLVWMRLFDVRMSGPDRILFTLGLEEFRLVRSEWSHEPGLQMLMENQDQEP